ncbi:MAG: C39 family peptidase [bacterium]|nr:C39 family peptidase [bacterium]
MKSISVLIVLCATGLGLWFFAFRDSSSPDLSISPITANPTTPPMDTSAPVATTPDEPSAPVPVILPPLPEKRPATPAYLPANFIINEIQFASQAPTKSWAMPYQEFCEEASSLMVAFYAQEKKMPSNANIKKELYRIKAYEEKTFGYYTDTTAEETASILKNFYKLGDVKVIKNPTADDIKTQLVAGKAIIVPTAGRMLNGPFYKRPGPLYHMLVLKGYTADGYFITQDPGTNTKGENFKFKITTVMKAMHDWNDGEVDKGAKVVIVVGKEKK